jgi:hypothetical protein
MKIKELIKEIYSNGEKPIKNNYRPSNSTNTY